MYASTRFQITCSYKKIYVPIDVLFKERKFHCVYVSTHIRTYMYMCVYLKLLPPLQIYKMTTELQSHFELVVLDFLKSYGSEKEEPPTYGTRRALGRLAHSVSSEETPVVVGGSHPAPLLPVRMRTRSRRKKNAILQESESDSENSSVGVSTPVTPLSETSSTFTVLAPQREMSARQRHNSLSQLHGMTLRSREKAVKRVLQESESEVETDEKEEEKVARLTLSPRRTRSRGTPHKRQRLSSDSDEELATLEEDFELPSVVTRTSRGRVIKPTSKFC